MSVEASLQFVLKSLWNPLLFQLQQANAAPLLDFVPDETSKLRGPIKVSNQARSLRATEPIISPETRGQGASALVCGNAICSLLRSCIFQQLREEGESSHTAHLLYMGLSGEGELGAFATP